MGRGEANIEDDLRVSIELYKGFLVQGDKKAEDLLISGMNLVKKIVN